MSCRYYTSVAEARNALALDAGFDVFVVQKMRCTRARLAEMGYIVDRAQAARERQEHRDAQAQARAREAAHSAAQAHALAESASCAADLAVMRRIADRLAATGAPVAYMELFGTRHDGRVRITYHDGRRPTIHDVRS